MAKSSNIVPLIILIIVVAILAVVGFVVYSIAHDVGHKTRQKLERKNVSFSKGGMKVGVKHVSQEQQEDAAQSVITNIWNNASFPAYKSPVLGWNQTNKTPTPGAEKRNPAIIGSTLTTVAQVLSQFLFSAVSSQSFSNNIESRSPVQDDFVAEQNVKK